MFGSSTVWVGLCSHCRVAALSHIHRHLCSSTDWGTDLTAKQFREVVYFSPVSVDWLATQILVSASAGYNSGTEANDWGDGKERNRAGLLEQALPWRKHPSFQFQKTQKRPTLQFLQQTTSKLTYAITNSSTCLNFYLGRLIQNRLWQEVDKSSRRSTWVVLQRGSKNPDSTDCEWEEGK